jgi:PAS domain S-box-containing protein
VVALVLDVSARGRAEAAVRESEARFRHMADAAPVMLWVTEADGRCTFLNRAWLEFTGQTLEQGLGLGWLDAVHPDDAADAERAFLDATARAGPFHVEYRLRRHDGAYRRADRRGGAAPGAGGRVPRLRGARWSTSRNAPGCSTPNAPRGRGRRRPTGSRASSWRT